MGCHLFWNGVKAEPIQIINLRRYLERLLQDAGITLQEKHHEHGILDTAPDADKKTFLTEIPVH
jgi:hypothetical protein